MDASKSASDIPLDYNIKVGPLPKPSVNWCYGLTPIDNTITNFNPKTLRPYYTVNGKRWDQCAIESYKISNINDLFKGCKYLENYVIKYEKQPNNVELILFYFNRYIEAGKVTTLPFLTASWAQDFT